MRRNTLKYLIYREFFLARKPIFVAGVVTLFMMIFGILVSLSTKYGNLAYVPEQYGDALEEGLLIFSCFLPPCMCTFVGMSVAELIQLECDNKWRRFRLSTPVKGYIFTLAKYLLLLGTVAVSIGITLAYMWVNSIITGNPIPSQNIAFVLAVTFIFLMFCLLMQILTLLLGSPERAGIALLGIWFPVMFFVMTSTWVVDSAGAGMQFLVDLSETYLPHISVVFVLFLIVSYVVTAALYERREK